jgi:uncharacterized protein YukE
MIQRATQAADDAAAEIRKNGLSLVADMQGQAMNYRGAAGTAFRNVLNMMMDDLNVILNRLETLSGNTREAGNKLLGQDQMSAASVNRIHTGGSVTSGLT